MRVRRLATVVAPLILLGHFLPPDPPAAAADALRVGTSGDYAPFSRQTAVDPPAYEGFDLTVARAFATARGLELEIVPFRWPALLDDLRAGKFDVAMSGITLRPERSAAGRFSVPVAEGGAVVLVREPERFQEISQLNRGIVRVGVNLGGHLERVAAARFPRATRVAIARNEAVREALLSEAVHAVVTDSFEAPVWMEGSEGLAALGPFTRDRKAYLVRADRPDLAADLDAWLLAREADGSLAHLRAEQLGSGAGPATATPLAALLAAVDERLALMPLVGAAKRREGLPLEVPEREALVLDAAVEAVGAAAEAAKVAPPPEPAVRSIYRALIEAAKEVQWETIQDPDRERPARVPDLEKELRPALLRIGEKLARLLVALPPHLERENVRAAAADALRTPRLSQTRARAIADAITRLSQAGDGS